MDALNIYISTWQLVFCSEADDAEAWASISKHFSCLRRALACCVCEKILSAPRHSADFECEHFVCRACVSQNMKFKQHCDCCNDPTKFVDHNLMRIVVNCFQCLCEYVINSSLLYKWGHLNGGKNSTLADIVQEGTELERDPNASDFHGNLDLLNSDYEPPLEIDHTVEDTSCNGTVSNGSCSFSNHVTEIDNSTRIMITRVSCNGTESTNQQDPVNDFVFKKPNMTVNMMRSFRLKKKGCRCGLATNNPGKLTCCGQRCPCYVDGKACLQCKCRGCRNPHKFNGKTENTSGVNVNNVSRREFNSTSSRSSMFHRRSSTT